MKNNPNNRRIPLPYDTSVQGHLKKPSEAPESPKCQNIGQYIASLNLLSPKPLSHSPLTLISTHNSTFQPFQPFFTMVAMSGK